MASLSDVLSTLQNGVVAINNFGIQLKTTLTRISTRFGNYLLLSGGTLTGDLAISKASPILSLDKAASGQDSSIRGTLLGSTRWFMSLGDTTAETGANAGSDFSLYRYSDAGAFIAQAFSVRRSDGSANFTGELSWTGSAWTVWTPTVVPTAGAFTTVSATGGYKVYGKLVHFAVTITVTAVGTAAGEMSIALPTGTAKRAGAVVAVETAVAGFMGYGRIATGGTTIFAIVRYDNASFISAGFVVTLSGSYELT